MKVSGNKSYFHGNLTSHKYRHETQLSRPEFYFQFCDRGLGERNMFFSFSTIGDFHLKEETVVMKRKATKPGGSGRKKSQVSPFKMFDFACEDRHVDPKA